MPRKCSAAGCRTGYDNCADKFNCYKFPSDPQELEFWCAALPNIVKPANITKYMCLCSKHWPEDSPMVTSKGRERPSVPPSIFPNIPETYKRQSISSVVRNVSERNVTFEERTSQPDELLQFLELDSITTDFNKFFFELKEKFPNYQILFSDKVIVIADFDLNVLPPVFQFSVIIDQRCSVSSFRQNTPVACRDLLGFQCHIQKWSQLEAVIHRVKQSPLNATKEVKAAVAALKNSLELWETPNDKYNFVIDQLDLLSCDPCGRRYNSETTLIALNMYLCSRSCYQILRNYLAFPHPTTLTKNIGSFVDVGSRTEADRTAKAAFDVFSIGQRKCMLLFDKVHIKPSIR